MIIFIALFTTLFSYAQNCSDLNLITQPNSPFQKLPVLDQSGSGMCYAYVAAQLANYQQIKSGAADRPVVHPAWAGTLYGGSDPTERDLRGGVTSTALDEIMKKGNCDEQIVRQAIKTRADLAGVPESKIFKFIDDYGLILRQGVDRSQALRIAIAKNPKCEKLSGMPELLGRDAIDIMERLLDQSCSPTTPLNIPHVQKMRQGNDNDFENRINDVLENGNPVGMTFCSWATDRPQSSPPQYVQTMPNGYRQATVDENTCGTHIALVAGRKVMNGSCNYLYRNSRGTGWYKDIQHLTCLCKNKKNGQFVDNCTFKTHNDGKHSVEACWVPKETIMPNIFDLTHF